MYINNMERKEFALGNKNYRTIEILTESLYFLHGYLLKQ